MPLTITSDTPQRRVNLVFYVKEDQNSPYQGMLSLPAAEWDALSDADIEAMQIAQFEAWKANVAAAQAQAEAAANAVPDQVTVGKAKQALINAGLWSQVQAAIDAAGPEVQLAWNVSDTFHRDNPLLLGLAQAIGLTSDQVDDLFREAARL